MRTVKTITIPKRLQLPCKIYVTFMSAHFAIALFTLFWAAYAEGPHSRVADWWTVIFGVPFLLNFAILMVTMLPLMILEMVWGVEVRFSDE